MSVGSATTSGTRLKTNSTSNGRNASVNSAVLTRKAGRIQVTAAYSLAPRFVIVLDHYHDLSREAHVFSTIEAALAFEYPARSKNVRVVRLPGDLAWSERALWEHIDRADREQRSIFIHGS